MRKDQPQRRRNYVTLTVLILLALAYRFLLGSQSGGLTGSNETDGILGVLLGLYVCSHPAANYLDLLFFGRTSLQVASSRRVLIVWAGFNLLTLLIGWVTMVLGTTRFFTRR
jgi:hypothetical protein